MKPPRSRPDGRFVFQYVFTENDCSFLYRTFHALLTPYIVTCHILCTGNSVYDGGNQENPTAND